MISDRRPELAALLDRILTEECLGEDFGYDIAPHIAATPAGLAAGYVLILSCRSPLVSPPRMASPYFIGDMWPDEENLRQAVKMCLDHLADLRRQMLSPSNGG